MDVVAKGTIRDNYCRGQIQGRLRRTGNRHTSTAGHSAAACSALAPVWGAERSPDIAAMDSGVVLEDLRSSV